MWKLYLQNCRLDIEKFVLNQYIDMKYSIPNLKDN